MKRSLNCYFGIRESDSIPTEHHFGLCGEGPDRHSRCCLAGRIRRFLPSACFRPDRFGLRIGFAQNRWHQIRNPLPRPVAHESAALERSLEFADFAEGLGRPECWNRSSLRAVKRPVARRLSLSTTSMNRRLAVRTSRVAKSASSRVSLDFYSDCRRRATVWMALNSSSIWRPSLEKRQAADSILSPASSERRFLFAFVCLSGNHRSHPGHLAVHRRFGFAGLGQSNQSPVRWAVRSA